MFNLSASIAYHARREPDRAAIIYRDEEISYADFHERIRQAAALLRSRGIGRNDVVALFMKNSAAFLELAYAASYLGAVFLPINYRLAAPEAGYILADANAKLLFVDDEFPEIVALDTPKVVVDGRLVTGQNPYSTPALADAFVRASGRVPVARTAWRDERSMALVERHLRGDPRVATELAQQRDTLHVELIGILGYYQLQAAQDPAAIADALSIMQLARPYMDEAQLDVGIAEAHWRLGRTDQARSQLQAVLEKQPTLEQAKALLARMQP